MQGSNRQNDDQNGEQFYEDASTPFEASVDGPANIQVNVVALTPEQLGMMQQAHLYDDPHMPEPEPVPKKRKRIGLFSWIGILIEWVVTTIVKFIWYSTLVLILLLAAFQLRDIIWDWLFSAPQ